MSLAAEYSCRAPGSRAAKGTATNFRARARRQEVGKDTLLLLLYRQTDIQGRGDGWGSVEEKRKRGHSSTASQSSWGKAAIRGSRIC